MSGTGLVLQNNLGDNLAISGNGAFTFSTPLADGSAYSVTVLNQPTNPSQTCSIAGSSGTLVGADVSNIAVTCSTNTYTVGGTVSGLSGTGLALNLNGSETLPVSANGSFIFTTALADNSPYNVTVSSHPNSPAQICSVSGGSGSLAGSNITGIAVTCVNAYLIGGSVSGLSGSGLVLQNNGGDNINISSNGTYQFSTAVIDTDTYNVSVLTQPSTPNQACVVSGGSGVVSGSDITSANVSCTTNQYSIGVSVSGLAPGNSVTLQNNLSDDLVAANNGSYTFASTISDLSSYNVTVLTQPATPSQTCSISNGSGSVSGADITGIIVSCATDSFTIGGTVSGLSGSGLVLQLNGADDLPVTANGSFSFPGALFDESTYEVTILTQPSSPTQVCAITNSGGTLAGADVTNVLVDCVDQHSISGTVTGLSGTGLVLQNNGADSLSIASNGVFEFSGLIASGDTYNVTVLTQPGTPDQICTISNGSGTASAAVSNITVSCVNSYLISLTVSGLGGTGLVLQNNGADDLSISTDGSHSFSTLVADGSTYDVTVLTQPSTPAQTCVVGNGTGTVSGAAVSNISVTCTNDLYSIGGTVSGLSGSGLILQNSGGDDLAISANGGFTFATTLDTGAVYNVSVLAQPTSPAQTCLVSNGVGVVGTTNVTNITVSCTTSQYSIGGTVTGLSGTGLSLINNSAEILAVSTNGAFTFTQQLDDASTYDVQVMTHPSSPNQTCTVTNGSGALSGADITNVSVDCVTNTYNVGGTVSGLSGTGLVLQNNSGDDLSVTANGAFSFLTAIPDGGSYQVSILTQPSSQECFLGNISGTIAGADVINVTVNCVNKYTIGGVVSGLTGTGLVLSNNGADTVTVNADGAFTFSTPLNDGSDYRVGIASQPSATEACLVAANGQGTLSGQNIADVVITCTSGVEAIGAVTPVYPVSGSRWNDYVLGDGTNNYNASDTACDGISAGCLHGGELRTATVASKTSCANLTVLDSLGAFDWTCDASSGSATFYTTGLNSSSGLSDLIDFDATAWIPMHITVLESGTPIALSSSSNWWTNAVENAVDIGGDGQEWLWNGSSVYLISDTTPMSYSPGADKIAMLVRPGLTLHGNTAQNTVGDVRTYGWFEGAVNANNMTYGITASGPYSVINKSSVVFGNEGIVVFSGSYSSVRNSSIEGSLQDGIRVSGQRARLDNLIIRNNIGSTANNGNNGRGIYVSGLGENTIANVRSTGNKRGIEIYNSNNTVVTDSDFSSNAEYGIYLRTTSDRNIFSNVSTNNNGSYGVLDWVTTIDGMLGNRFDRLVSSNNRNSGVRILHAQTVLANSVIANNSLSGIDLNGSNIVLINTTVANSGGTGVSSMNGGTRIFSQNLLVTGSGHGLPYVAPGIMMMNNTYSDFVNTVSAHNNKVGIQIAGDNWTSAFHGVLKVGGNQYGDCETEFDSSIANPIIDDSLPAEDVIHEGLCLQGGVSTFGTAVTGVSLANSFLGKVAADDLTNPDDTDGTASYEAITNWSVFDSSLRAWGLDGLPFPSTSNRGNCLEGMTCRIWDWRLSSSDTGDAGSAVVYNVLAVPIGDDVVTHESQTILRNASEIHGDGIGNDDFLCESNETCLYTPNIGAYQGHGNLIWAGPFTDGVITGVTLMKYENNGY